MHPEASFISYPFLALTSFVIRVCYQVGVLKNDISAGQILVKELRKKDKIESEESMYVQDELNNDIMELDVSFSAKLLIYRSAKLLI